LGVEFEFKDLLIGVEINVLLELGMTEVGSVFNDKFDFFGRLKGKSFAIIDFEAVAFTSYALDRHLTHFNRQVTIISQSKRTNNRILFKSVIEKLILCYVEAEGLWICIYFQNIFRTSHK